MDDLNFRHLLYFWTVTQERSVTRASRKLKVAQPTISAQLKKLETSLGTQLFRRSGRALELTETGRKVQRYAEQIFTLGRELLADIHGSAAAAPAGCRLGVVRDLPSAGIEPWLSAALSASASATATIVSGTAAELFADLAGQRLDVVLAGEADQPLGSLRTHRRLLGEASVVLVGREELAVRYRRGFPGSLQKAPLILPMPDQPLRRSVDRWLSEHRLHPPLAVESNDEVWRLRLCLAGQGLTLSTGPQPSPGLDMVGRLSNVIVRCYAHTLDRQPGHPVVRALLQAGLPPSS
uniref:LysR family transcriptional regulator n=1 Tax=Schlesneria paludicola TaxID=360056 RepID=A0A7C4QRK1_9PLAN